MACSLGRRSARPGQVRSLSSLSKSLTVANIKEAEELGGLHGPGPAEPEKTSHLEGLRKSSIRITLPISAATILCMCMTAA